jgi:hypothetical protein
MIWKAAHTLDWLSVEHVIADLLNTINWLGNLDDLRQIF